MKKHIWITIASVALFCGSLTLCCYADSPADQWASIAAMVAIGSGIAVLIEAGYGIKAFFNSQFYKCYIKVKILKFMKKTGLLEAIHALHFTHKLCTPLLPVFLLISWLTNSDHDPAFYEAIIAGALWVTIVALGILSRNRYEYHVGFRVKRTTFNIPIITVIQRKQKPKRSHGQPVIFLSYPAVKAKKQKYANEYSK